MKPPRIRRIRVSPRVEDKIWREHHVLPEELWDVLFDDDEMIIYSGKQGEADFIAIGRTRGGRKLLVAFYVRSGIADIATGFDID